MRISFTGTGGVGKTTLARALAAYLNLELRHSRTREVHEKWGISESGQDTLSTENLVKLQNEIFEANYDLLIWQGDYVSDRSLLCSFAYTYQRSAAACEAEYPRYERMVLDHIESLDALIYIPLDACQWELEGDGFRASNDTLRVTHDLLVRGILTKYGIHEKRNFFEITAHDLALRKLEVGEIIGSLA